MLPQIGHEVRTADADDAAKAEGWEVRTLHHPVNGVRVNVEHLSYLDGADVLAAGGGSFQCFSHFCRFVNCMHSL